jgi:hypothetical protein
MVDDATLQTVSSDDVYSCSALVVHRLPPVGDFAVLRLDRPVKGRQPAKVRLGARSVGEDDALLITGCPSGIPIKIADSAKVRENRANFLDFFVANLDSFEGNSGSGVFLAGSKELVGILTRGEEDYVTDGTCRRVNVCADGACLGERSVYAFWAIGELCRLDGTDDLAVCSCGDGDCQAAMLEDTAGCPADCGSLCGDGVCNGNENPVLCSVDCGLCGNQVCDATESESTCCRDCACIASLTCQVGVACGPRGDSCSESKTLGAQGTQVVQGNLRALHDLHQGRCQDKTGGVEEVYRFTLSAKTTVVAEASGFDTVLYLRSSCQDRSTELACNDDEVINNPASKLILDALEPGSYFLFLDAYDESASGRYTLTVNFYDVVDSDADGVIDGLDPCPHDAGASLEGDSDADGVIDCLDECPNDKSATKASQCQGGGCSTLDGDGTAFSFLFSFFLVLVFAVGRKLD